MVRLSEELNWMVVLNAIGFGTPLIRTNGANKFVYQSGKKSCETANPLIIFIISVIIVQY